MLAGRQCVQKRTGAALSCPQRPRCVKACTQPVVRHAVVNSRGVACGAVFPKSVEPKKLNQEEDKGDLMVTDLSV